MGLYILIFSLRNLARWDHNIRITRTKLNYAYEDIELDDAEWVENLADRAELNWSIRRNYRREQVLFCYCGPLGHYILGQH